MFDRLKTVIAATFVAVPMALAATAGGAATFTLDATSRGCLESDGTEGCGNSFQANGNFFTGENFSQSEQLRSFFLFDLSGVSGTVTGVSLKIDVGNILADPGPESVGFFQVSQASFNTLAGGSGSGAVYGDLGTGINLGGPTLDTGDSDSLINFAGGASWISAVSGALGGDFGFGGSLLTYNSAEREGVFGGSTGNTFQLVIDTADAPVVPLPAGMPLLLAGLGGLALLRRRS